MNAKKSKGEMHISLLSLPKFKASGTKFHFESAVLSRLDGMLSSNVVEFSLRNSYKLFYPAHIKPFLPAEITTVQ